MAEMYDSMMTPKVEGLLDQTDSKFALCTLASSRARQIISYFGLLGEGVGSMVPPQVTSIARKPLSIAFEEIAAHKIVAADPDTVSDDESSDGEANSVSNIDEVIAAAAAGNGSGDDIA